MYNARVKSEYILSTDAGEGDANILTSDPRLEYKKLFKEGGGVNVFVGRL